METQLIASDYELERGKPMPTLTHGVLQANLIVQLAVNYGDHYTIASEVALATVPEGSTPDIVAYPRRELNFIDEPARQTDAPLLVIEIQSSSQSTEEMIAKTNRYFAFGIQSCWVVFPALRGVAVYSAPDSYTFFHHQDRLRDSTLSIEVDLGKIFA